MPHIITSNNWCSCIHNNVSLATILHYNLQGHNTAANITIAMLFSCVTHVTLSKYYNVVASCGVAIGGYIATLFYCYCRSHRNFLTKTPHFLLIKFSVAPESRSAVVSALLFDVWRNTCIDIDWRFDKYTRSELPALIKADLIRQSENPAPLLHSCDIWGLAFPLLIALQWCWGLTGLGRKRRWW